MADKKISELDLALQINNDAEFPFSQDNAGEPTTFKGRITQLGTKIAEDMTFSNLRTTSKKLVGAINELLSLGSPIIIGTTAPTSSQGADGNLYVQYTAGTGSADDEVDGIYVKIDGAWCEISTGGGSGTTDYDDLSNKPQVNSVELVGNKSLDDLGIMPASLSKTVSGNIIHFTDGADNIPVKSLVSEIVAVESGSGEKSPTNPYTISGFDSGVITRCGKNLANFTDGYGISTSGEIVSNVKRTSTVNPIKVDNTKTYVFTFTGSNIVGAYAVWNNNTLVRRITGFGGGDIDVSGGNLVYLSCYNSAESSSTPATTKADCTPQLEQNTTATTFEAYNGNTYTFAFGQTVYGGHFDNKGNLVVTYAQTDINSAINNRTTSCDNPVFYGSINGLKPQSNNSLCECFNTINGRASAQLFAQNSNNHDFAINSLNTGDTIQVFLRADEYSDVASLKSACGNSKIIYELANPITLANTSQDIPTLLGENNIFSNCGDLEVDYYTDNADEIVEVVISTLSTSLHNYSTNEQIVGTWIDGSTLYEKTVYISSLPNNATIEYITGLSNITPISFDNTIIFQSGNTSKAPYVNSGGTVRIAIQFNADGKIYFGTNTDQSTTSAYVTIRYTKSST